MSRKLIQVPVEPDLLLALDSLSKREGRSRSDVVREACRRYLEWIEGRELDRRYEEGYARLPEEPAIGEVQASLAGEVLPAETW